MKIYAFSGLGADERVFHYLKLKHELIPVSWIQPQKNESLENYSKRLAISAKINEDENFAVMGVSFGGLIATEISKIYNPKKTILISSIETKQELKTLYKLSGRIGLINILPINKTKPPIRLMNYFFGAKNKKLLKEIIDDSDFDFVKWAMKELVNWKNLQTLSNAIIISGTKDKLLKSKNPKANLILEGEHFMIVDRADEISEIINQSIES